MYANYLIVKFDDDLPEHKSVMLRIKSSVHSLNRSQSGDAYFTSKIVTVDPKSKRLRMRFPFDDICIQEL